MLARVVWHEARGEPRAAKELIASTVLERVQDPRWPDTIEEVLIQSWQFEDFDPSARPDPRTPGWSDCVRAARAALAATPAGGANHFHAANITPWWHDPAKVVSRAGRHVFLRL